MPLLQGLIFDLEGTLIDGSVDLRHAVNTTLKAHGRRPLTPEEARRMAGEGIMPFLNGAFAVTGAKLAADESYDRFQEFLVHYRNQNPDTAQIYPHVLETLENFYAAGIKLGICTNKPEASTIYLLKALELKRYFTFIAGGDTFQVHKPNPGHVAGVAEALYVPAANCAMIGDSRNDVTAAHGAGVPCIVVTHGHGGDFGALGAKALVNGFKELCAALKTLGFEGEAL